MTQSIYLSIFHFIDEKMCHPNYIYEWRTNPGKYILINFSNEFSKREKAKFFPFNLIYIYQDDPKNPEYNLEKVGCLLHEYGHYLSLKRGSREYLAESGYDYEMDDDLQRAISVKEEVQAWKYGFGMVKELPIGWKDKLLVRIVMLRIMVVALFEYWMWSKGWN
jgi:hypothetical protein